MTNEEKLLHKIAQAYQVIAHLMQETTNESEKIHALNYFSHYEYTENFLPWL